MEIRVFGGETFGTGCGDQVSVSGDKDERSQVGDGSPLGSSLFEDDVAQRFPASAGQGSLDVFQAHLLVHMLA
jgi:hypothetical protein